jgi:hypothetical protein
MSNLVIFADGRIFKHWLQKTVFNPIRKGKQEILAVDAKIR